MVTSRTVPSSVMPRCRSARTLTGLSLPSTASTTASPTRSWVIRSLHATTARAANSTLVPISVPVPPLGSCSLTAEVGLYESRA
jgi:hypothetical protein